MIRVALDSMPLTAVRADCRDHSGSQLFGLTTQPLVAFSLRSDALAPVAAREVVSSEDGTRHRFVLRDDLRWSDGQRATPLEFCEPLAAAVAELPRTPESFWLKNVAAVEPTRDGLEIRTKRPHFRLPALTSMLRVAARRTPGGTIAEPQLGRFRIASWAADRVRLEASDLVVEMVRVKDPLDNVARYDGSDLDLTADTAFPYERVPAALSRPELRVTQPGIFVSLGFGGALASADALPTRARIRDAIDRDALATALGGVLVPKRDFVPTAGPLRPVLERATTGVLRIPSVAPAGPGALRLVYDDYYPNREICAVLAAQLEQAGLPVELVGDSFEQPTVEGDLRLTLGKAVHPGELGMYHGLMFLRPLRARRADLEAYAGALRSSEILPLLDGAAVGRIAAELQAILDRTVAVIPLAELPGLALSRIGTSLGPSGGLS